MPKISVLMPVYNVKEEFLKEAIESILNQTYGDFEFLILDDCSTLLNVEKIVKSYNDDRIIFYKNEENLGIAKNRNKLMKLARGKYAAIVDSDDISLSERFEKQVDFLDKNPDVTVLSTGYKTFPNKTVVIHPKQVGAIDLLDHCVVTHPSAMIRLADFKRMGLEYNIKFECAEDYELWSRAVRYFKIANLQEVLLYYRVSECSITQRKESVLKQNEILIRKNILNFLTSDKNIQNKIKDMLCNTELDKGTFLQKIFSVRNARGNKAITILGHNFIIKRQEF